MSPQYDCSFAKWLYSIIEGRISLASIWLSSRRSKIKQNKVPRDLFPSSHFVSNLTRTVLNENSDGLCVCLLIVNIGKTTILKILGGKHMVEPHMVRVLGRSAFHDTSLTSSGDLSYLGGEVCVSFI